MEQIAEFLSSGLLKKNYDPDQFLNLVANNIYELKKHGLYPAPSVVEGELPVDRNLVYSTLTERTKNRNRVAMKIMEIEKRTSILTSSNDESHDLNDLNILESTENNKV